MPWDKEPAKTPQRIDRVTIHLAILKSEDGTITYDAVADVGVVMSDGTSNNRVVQKLEDHLTGPQKTAIQGFLGAMLSKAETEIL